MATLDTVYRGQSHAVDFYLTDEDGVAINLATFDDIWVVCYHKYSKVQMETWQDSLGTVVTVDAATGHARVILNEDDTVDAQTGIYSLDVISEEPDVNYEDNTRYRAWSWDKFILKPLQAESD